MQARCARELSRQARPRGGRLARWREALTLGRKLHTDAKAPSVFVRGDDFQPPYSDVTILGAPFSEGQPFQGSEQGPQLIRNNGLHQVLTTLKWRVDEQHDLEFQGGRSSDPKIAEEDLEAVGGPCNQHYAVGQAAKKLYEKVNEIAKQDTFPLILGGDHSLGMGVVSGILAARPDTAIIWVDAHADVNTPATSSSGNMHGMPLAFCTDNGIPYEKIPGLEWLADVPRLAPENLVYIGLRDVDPGERKWLKEHGCGVFTMQDVDRYGIGTVMDRALAHVGNRPIHLSYDIDAVDPMIAPSTGTAVRGGLTYREAHFCAEAISDTGNLHSMDLVEVNPSLSPDGAKGTVNMALGIIASAFGARIL